jgi:hypothetical protein
MSGCMAMHRFARMREQHSDVQRPLDGELVVRDGLLRCMASDRGSPTRADDHGERHERLRSRTQRIRHGEATSSMRRPTRNSGASALTPLIPRIREPRLVDQDHARTRAAADHFVIDYTAGD